MNEQNELSTAAETAVAPPRTLEMIGAEIRTFTASMLNNIIEIGRRMCEAKELVPYGRFGDWIKTNTGYSTSTANNFMRLYQEYGAAQGSLFGATVEDDQTFGNLSYTKALALLALPAGERVEFVEAHDVDAMSTRELKEAIRERDEALKRAELSEEKRKIAEQSSTEALENADKEIDDLRAQIKELESRPAPEADPATVQKAVDEALKEYDTHHAAEMDKLKKKLEKAEKNAAKAEKAAKEAETRAETAGKDAGGEVDALRAEAERLKAETEGLRKELAVSGDKELAAFELLFEQAKEAVNKLIALLATARSRGDWTRAETLQKALLALAEGVKGAAV